MFRTKCKETNHHKPVRKTYNGEVEHLGVTKDFAEGHLEAQLLVVATC